MLALASGMKMHRLAEFTNYNPSTASRYGVDASFTELGRCTLRTLDTTLDGSYQYKRQSMVTASIVSAAQLHRARSTSLGGIAESIYVFESF